MPHYLCELLLRLKQGALFRGQFYLYGDPSLVRGRLCRQQWVRTSSRAISSNRKFSSSPPARLIYISTRWIDLTESGDLVLQENLDGILLEDTA